MFQLTNAVLIRSVDRTIASQTSDSFYLNLAGYNLNGKYAVTSAALPNTFYSVDSTKNKIYFTQLATPYVATIASGNYNTSTLPAAVSTALNAAGATGTFSTVYNSATATITITNTSTAWFLTFATNTTSSAARVLGFSSLNTASALTQTSDKCLLLAPLSATILFNQGSSNTGLNIAKNYKIGVYIPLTVAFGGVCNYTSTERFAQYVDFADNANGQLQLDIRDSQNNALSLNGSEYEILLQKV
jgi:hypothetical protein